jgi:glycosyltransferase involved in cell wall biosynthesis
MNPRPYDVVVALSYFTPYVSGLTETARLVAEGAARSGMRVLVVTPRYDSALPTRERIGGVEVVRCNVIAHVSKGVLSPSFPFVAARLARRARLLHLHLPLIEAGVIVQLVGGGTRVVCDYHCDVDLSAGLLNRAIVTALDASSWLALRRADTIVVSTTDFAESSRLRRSLRHRVVAILPPVVPHVGGRPLFRSSDGPHIGFLGRIVAEKGIDHLVAAFRRIDDPAARLLIAGDYTRVAGGSVISLVRAAAGDDSRIRLLGFLADDRLADFFASIDVFALPSINSLETFGVAQVEAMMAGVPVLASDLPGVRQPVLRTGFGRLVPPGDVAGLQRAMVSPFGGEGWTAGAAERARSLCSVDEAVRGYLRVYSDLGVSVSAAR